MSQKNRTHRVNLGQDYLFVQPMADEGVYKKTCLKTVIICALSFDDAKHTHSGCDALPTQTHTPPFLNLFSFSVSCSIEVRPLIGSRLSCVCYTAAACVCDALNDGSHF